MCASGKGPGERADHVEDCDYVQVHISAFFFFPEISFSKGCRLIIQIISCKVVALYQRINESQWTTRLFLFYFSIRVSKKNYNLSENISVKRIVTVGQRPKFLINLLLSLA